ncbi:MAG: hypothetical protein ACPGRD_12415, partial [Planktomarina sp.]
RKQGVSSSRDNGQVCLYRGPNNTACLIGHLIPDEEYKPYFDEDCPTIQEVLRRAFNIDYDTDIEDAWLAFQSCHDYAARDEMEGNFMELFEERFKIFCEEHGYTYNPPKEV